MNTCAKTVGGWVAGPKPHSPQALAVQIIPLAGLHHVILLLNCDVKLVIPVCGTRVRRVAQAVLAAQFVFDLMIDLVDRLFLGDLEHSASRFGGNLRQDLLPVRPLLREALIAPAAPAIGTPAPAIRTAAITAARPPEPAVSLLIGKQDRIHDRVGPLRRLDGVLQRLLASAIYSVGKDDHRLAALLFPHDFVRREIDRVVKRGAASHSPRSSPTAAGITATTGISTAPASVPGARIVFGRRDLQQPQRGFQFLVRRGQVLQQLHLAIEVNQEGLVLVAQQVGEKAAAGVALIRQNAPLAHAGIHQQPQRQRQIGLARKIRDRLRAPVFFQFEIVLTQIPYDLAFLVAHGGEHIHHLDVDRDGGLIRRGFVLSGQRSFGSNQQKQQRTASPQAQLQYRRPSPQWQCRASLVMRTSAAKMAHAIPHSAQHTHTGASDHCTDSPPGPMVARGATAGNAKVSYDSRKPMRTLTLTARAVFCSLLIVGAIGGMGAAALAPGVSAFAPSASAFAKDKPLAFKSIENALLRVNDAPPKDWEVYRTGKKNEPLLLQIGNRFLLLEINQHQVFELDPAKIEHKTGELLWSPSDRPDKPLATSEWTVDDIGAAFVVKVKLQSENALVDLQLPHPPNVGDLPNRRLRSNSSNAAAITSRTEESCATSRFC